MPWVPPTKPDNTEASATPFTAPILLLKHRFNNMKQTLALIAVLFLSSLAALQAAKPNILHIHADDHRPDGAHALGTPLLQTPNLDSLVERGENCVTFDDADDASMREALHVGPGTGDVVGPQPLVEREAHGVGEQLLSRATLESAVPVIDVAIQNRDTTVNVSTILLRLNGANVPATITATVTAAVTVTVTAAVDVIHS